MKETNLVGSDVKIDFEPVLARLDEELSVIGQTLTLVCAGGYVMQQNGYRGTSDIDAFYENNAEIESIIKKIGDEFGINKPDEMWLNNSISNMNPAPPDEFCETIYTFSKLTVKSVGINYLIGMKLTSGREQDLIDIGTILKHDNNKQPFELYSLLAGMGFDIDISVMLDAYEKAHGMDWLDDFYLNNQDNLREYF